MLRARYPAADGTADILPFLPELTLSQIHSGLRTHGPEEGPLARYSMKKAPRGWGLGVSRVPLMLVQL